MKSFEEYYRKNLAETKKKIRQSVKTDNIIVTEINNLEDTGKAANMLAKNLREWCELCCPEFSSSVADHKKFAESVAEKDRKSLLKLAEAKEEESMGAELGKEDSEQIRELAREVVAILELKEKQTSYLEELMKKSCPNITAIAGGQIGAKLIALAGSLEKLAMLPASTIQVLGAEKALFRHLRNKKSKPPKHGILHEHPMISGSKREMHGKIARALADKISIAAKLDYFKGEFLGEKLRKALEAKFK